MLQEILKNKMNYKIYNLKLLFIVNKKILLLGDPVRSAVGARGVLDSRLIATLCVCVLNSKFVEPCCQYIFRHTLTHVYIFCALK